MRPLRDGKKEAMNKGTTNSNGFQHVLERKEADLAQALRRRDDIAMEKSADQLDEIQYATERDLAMRNKDRESILLREVRAALARLADGTYGACIQCEEAISPKRLAAVAWAPRCIQCQEAADRDREEGTESVFETLIHAA